MDVRRIGSALSGQAALELALVIPPMLLLLVYGVDVAMLWNSQARVDAAAAEGARFLAADPSATEVELAEAARAASGLDGAAEVALTDSWSEDGTLEVSTPSGTLPVGTSKSGYEVTVSLPYRPMFSATASALGGDGTVTLTSTAACETAAVEDVPKVEYGTFRDVFWEGPSATSYYEFTVPEGSAVDIVPDVSEALADSDAGIDIGYGIARGSGIDWVYVDHADGIKRTFQEPGARVVVYFLWSDSGRQIGIPIERTVRPLRRHSGGVG